MSRCSVRLVDHDLIEQQVLLALSDKPKVACIFDCADLTALIEALRAKPHREEKHTALLDDMLQLRTVAFGISRKD